MKFRDWIYEEITTSTTGNLGADSVTSNKLINIRLTDDKIKKIVNSLKKRKGVKVKKKDDNNITLDLPYETPQSIMKKLSKYSK